MTENEALKILKYLNKPANEEDYTYEECVEAVDVAIQALEEIQAYRAIGTVEEFKALKEKNEPKKPIDLSTVKDGNSYYYIGRCPRCKDLVSEDDVVCEECHQVLDWS